ncbi:phosphoribosylglycinamide formyltransferase [Candidatus Saccharibacteria bacterium]|nr:phosphoribosylglycinamide formyltransferase [Candidatus Saccharibacteria bacterium]
MINIAVFASGNGTTLQSIIDNIQHKKLDVNISLVVSNTKNAYALQRAKRAGIATYVIKTTTPAEMDAELVKILKDYKIDLILLAGYLKLIGSGLINRYTIVNTHPALLPKFGGKGMYGMNVHRAVIAVGEKQSGVTLHFVNEHYDKGNIIMQTKVKVAPNDTPESLAARVQAAEKIQLLKALQKFAAGELKA